MMKMTIMTTSAPTINEKFLKNTLSFSWLIFAPLKLGIVIMYSRRIGCTEILDASIPILP